MNNPVLNRAAWSSIACLMLIESPGEWEIKSKIVLSFVNLLPVIIISIFQDFREDMLMAFYFTQTQNFSPTPYLIKSLFVTIVCLFITRFYNKFS